MQSVCRTCLSSDALRPLFPVKSKYQSFVRALYLCTGLKITMNDGLPQYICKECAKLIECAIRFRNQSHASEIKLIQYHNLKKKQIELKSKITSNIYAKTVLIDSLPKIEEPNTKNDHLEVEYESDADDNINRSSSTNDDEWIKNEQSDEEFNAGPVEHKGKGELKQKVTKNAVDDRYLHMMEISDDTEKPNRCKVCKKSMKTIYGLRAHIKRHISDFSFLCEFCGKPENSQISLDRHQQSKHGLARGNRFHCSYCDFRALDQEMLEVHERRTHTKERPFVCDECGDAFYSRRVLRQHAIRHITDKLFQCDSCHQTFKSKQRLCGHFAKVHRGRKYEYSCPYCPNIYRIPSESRKHIEKVHGIPKDQQIKMDDGLPQNICNACARFIEASIQFRNKSHVSEKKLFECHKQQKNMLESQLEKKSIEMSKKKSEPVEIIVPTQDIIVEIEPKLEKDNLNYVSDTDDYNVIPICSTNEDRWNETEQWQAEFNISPENKKKGQAKNTISESTVDNDYLNMMETSNEPGKLYKCKVCKKSMKTQRGLQTHLTLHTLRYKVLCEFCGKPEFSRIHLLRHQQSKHGLARDNRYACSYCDYKALDLEMLEVHERHTHTKERPFVCDECGEAFYSKRVLKQHFLKHTTDKPFQCDQCQKNYKSRSRLTGHIMLVHRTRKYEYGCPHCAKTYYKPWESRKHIARIHGIPKDQQGKIPRFNLQQKDI